MELAQHIQMRLEVKLVHWRITYNYTNIITPIHLGIAILIHHNHGSRSLIDTVHSYGSCVSYDELRRFLTSAAENEQRHVQNGI